MNGEGAGDPLAVPSLADWRATTGLLWFGFWARELVRWGTLDPFVAFALAQGRASTREFAEALRPAFDAWLSGEIDNHTSEDFIDPQQFLSWERSLPRRLRDIADEPAEAAVLTGTDGSRKRYDVLPISADEEVIWIDPAGYELARSDDPLGAFSLRDANDDFVLVAGQQESLVSRAFRRRGRRQ